MSKYLVFLFLSAFVLAQIAQSLPTREETKAVVHTEEEFLKLVEDFSSQLADSLTRTKTIAENVLKEETVANVVSELMLTHKNKFSEYVSLANTIQNQEVKDDLPSKILKNTASFFLLVEFHTITSKYDTTKLETPTPEDHVIETSLKKNGLTEYKNEVDAKRSKITKERDEYRVEMLEHLKEKATEVSAIAKEFYDEKDDSKRFEIISKLFKLYA